jgi:hypothetical protein
LNFPRSGGVNLERTFRLEGRPTRSSGGGLALACSDSGRRRGERDTSSSSMRSGMCAGRNQCSSPRSSTPLRVATFDPRVGADAELEREREIEKLHAKIGQLSVGALFLARLSSTATTRCCRSAGNAACSG